MQRDSVSVLGISEVRWKGQGETRSGNYMVYVYHSGAERAERSIVVHKTIVRSVFKEIVCSARIIALK